MPSIKFASASLLALTIALAGPAAFAQAPAPAAAAARPAAAPVWPHDASDLRPQSDVRFGRLDNGMRYAILRNSTPAGQASLRLKINAGAIQEADDQLGYAHFLEHMTFNGTTNVEEGEMIRILERAGLQFGPDTNAYTSFTETVYQLDLPRTDAATLETGLMLMRESAGEALIDPAAVDRERGVVLSEERTRATPGYRLALANYRFLLQGQRAPERFPIGTVASLQSPNAAARIRDFYRAWYRPENTTIVAVGDFDVTDMERRVREKFSNWRGVGAAGVQPDFGRVAQRAADAEVFVEPGVPTTVQIAWARAPDLRTETRSTRREDTIQDLALAVLNRRLERLARSDNPPFVSASAGQYTQVRSADMTLLSITGQPGRWREGMEAAETERKRLAEFGVTQAELDREIAEERADLERAAAAAATRQTPQLANAIARSLEDDEVFTSPADDLAIFTESTRGLTAAQVNTALRELFTGSGPLVFASSPTPIEGGEQAVLAAYQAAAGRPVQAGTAAAVIAWPYESFGAPGAVAERREVADLQTTFVRFANGVRLTVRPSQLRREQILVNVRVGDGTLAQPANQADATWSANLAVPEAGLRDLTSDQLEEALTGVTYGASFGVGDDAFTYSGGTRPQDFARQMQLLAAYVAHPGWRPQGHQRLQSFADTLHDQFETSPGGVLARDLGQLLHAGDRRFGTPSREEMRALSFDQLRALLEPQLRTGAIEVVIAGDITVDEAIRQTAATFGALPRRTADPAGATAPGRRTAFPRPTAEPVRLLHRGRTDQGAAFVAWPTDDFVSNPQQARELRILQQVLQLRLIEEIRERQGVTYSPGTRYEASFDFPDYGYIGALIEAPPERLAQFFTDVDRVAQTLRDTPVSADELARAKNPWLEQRQRLLQTNEYWLSALADAQTDPVRVAAIREQVEGLRRVTAADVQRVAREYLQPGRAWRLLAVPGPNATPAAGPGPAAAPPAPPGREGYPPLCGGVRPKAGRGFWVAPSVGLTADCLPRCAGENRSSSRRCRPRRRPSPACRWPSPPPAPHGRR